MNPIWVFLTQREEQEKRKMNENITDSGNLASYEEGEEDIILYVTYLFHVYYVPVMIGIGIILNTFVSVVLLKTRLRKRFHSHIIAAICICDVGYLLTCLPVWLRDWGFDVYVVPGLCQMVIFMMHFFPFLSFWHIIATCFLIMACPKCQSLTNTCNNVGKARTLVISISIFTFTVFIYKTWTNGVVRINDVDLCMVLPETGPAMRILNILDMVVLLLLPLCLFVIFHIITIINFILKTVVTKSISRSYLCRDYFKVIFAYTVCFHIFVGPSCILHLLVLFKAPKNYQPNYKDAAIEKLIQYVFNTYFAMKPLIYMSISRSFRYHMKELMSKAKQTITITRTVVANSQSQEQTLL